jgi:hypothetical protein
LLVVANDLPDQSNRRKVLVQALPFMLNVLWEARSVLSPGKLVATAVDQYSKFEKDIEKQRIEFNSLFQDLTDLDLEVNGLGRLSLTLDRGQALALIGNFLTLRFMSESSRGAEFVIQSEGSEYDAVLNLPMRRIFASLRREFLNNSAMASEVEKVKDLNPSEAWIFCCQDGMSKEIPFDPIFVNETLVLRGALRILSVSAVFDDLSKGRFRAHVEYPELVDEKIVRIRFLLMKSYSARHD